MPLRVPPSATSKAETLEPTRLNQSANEAGLSPHEVEKFTAWRMLDRFGMTESEKHLHCMILRNAKEGLELLLQRFVFGILLQHLA